MQPVYESLEYALIMTPLQGDELHARLHRRNKQMIHEPLRKESRQAMQRHRLEHCRMGKRNARERDLNLELMSQPMLDYDLAFFETRFRLADYDGSVAVGAEMDVDRVFSKPNLV